MPPHARRSPAVERVQRRVERLQRVDARRQRRLDRRAAQRGVQAARGDLDLGQLGHAACWRSRCATRAGRSRTISSPSRTDAATPPFLRSTRAPVRSWTTCDEVRFVADDQDALVLADSGRSSSTCVVGVEARAQRLVLDRLAAERLAGQPRGVARAHLRAGEDVLEARRRARASARPAARDCSLAARRSGARSASGAASCGSASPCRRSQRLLRHHGAEPSRSGSRVGAHAGGPCTSFRRRVQRSAVAAALAVATSCADRSRARRRCARLASRRKPAPRSAYSTVDRRRAARAGRTSPHSETRACPGARGGQRKRGSGQRRLGPAVGEPQAGLEAAVALRGRHALARAGRRAAGTARTPARAGCRRRCARRSRGTRPGAGG